MKTRSLFLALGLTALLAGCGGAPGADDSEDDTAKADAGGHGGRQAGHLEGRRRHAHGLGPGGPRRSDASRSSSSTRSSRRSTRTSRSSASRSPSRTCIKTVKLAASGSDAPDVVQANQGRPIMGEMVKGGPDPPGHRLRRGLRLGGPLLAAAAGPQQVLARRQGVRLRRALRALADGRDRRRLLQQDQGPEPPATLDRVRGVAAGGQGRGRDADHVRQPREVAGHPQLRERARADRRQAGDPRLRVRQGGRDASTTRSSSPAPRRSRSGSTRATSTRTSTAPTTTRRGRSSPRARAAT